jgi:periplasmic protein CpxP/Spy
MRIFAPPISLSAALIVILSGSVLSAQDQPAAGAPPPAATSQAPSQVPPSDAQPNHAPDPQRQAKMMAKRLSLTNAQQSQIASILAGREQQLQSARADTTLAPKVRRARVQGIQQDSESKIEAILSDTQKQQYEQLKQERLANRQMRGQQQTEPPPTANNP